MQEKYYHFKWWQPFVIYVLAYVFATWTTNTFILNDSYYYSAFGSQLSSERMAYVIEINHKFQWLGYIGLPLVLILKWVLVAGIVYLGLFLFNQEISFHNCYKIVIIAEISTLVGAFVKLFCFLINPPQTIQDLQAFYPMALTQVFNLKQFPAYLIYPLQQFNLFEVCYWLLITMGIKAYIQKSFSQSLKITASSYGVALMVWILCVVFIQLQFT